MRQVVTDDAREHFVAIYLDGRHRAIGHQVVSVGTATASLVHPREVFQPAILAGACAVIVGHNHPSGDPSPSPEDRAVTLRLEHAQQIAAHESPRTTKLYDRTQDRISLDEIEKILI
jgi:DNA repair protein RadC